MDGISIRHGVVLVLLAVVPIAVFILDRNDPAVALALANVVVIAASYWVMFGPAEDGDHGDHGAVGGE